MINVVILVSFLTVFLTLFLQVTTINLLFLSFIVGVAACNIFMKWIEQWLDNRVQLVLHRLNRFLLLYVMCYFLLGNDWMYVLALMSVKIVYLIYFTSKKKKVELAVAN